MLPVSPPVSYLATLEKIILPTDKRARLLWPDHWVESRGNTGKPRPDAPTCAIILPIAVVRENDLDRGEFALHSSNTKADPLEVIRPDVDNAAYVARWMGVLHSIHSPLLVKSTAAPVKGYDDDPDIILAWFFYPDPNVDWCGVQDHGQASGADLRRSRRAPSRQGGWKR